MAEAYLDWLTELFDEAQVTYDATSADYLDSCLRRIAKVEDGSGEEVYRVLRDTWLKLGPPGRQLLASLLRHEVYAKRDSPMRPKEGVGYFRNSDT